MNVWQEILIKTEHEHNRFLSSLSDPEAEQQAQLMAMLEENKNTELGRRYGFSGIRNIFQFQSSVPVINYADISASIQRMATGAQGVLFSDAMLFLEKTAGSTRGEKLIPYNCKALQALQRGLYPWLHDLLQHRPGCLRGKSYWSISPAMRQSSASTSVPIGIQNDALYFGEVVAPLLQMVLVIPANVIRTQSFSQWRYETLRCLLQEERLSFISIWSPTFLSDLLRWFANNSQALIEDIYENGALERARHLAEVVTAPQLDATRIWPHLDTVSCWTQGGARPFIPELAQYLPGVNIQGKGLLATEGMITLPLTNAADPVLAINSGFYEFIDENEKTFICTELEYGRVYEVILTTWAGLYRYRLGDRVRVTGYMNKTPLLELLGRAGLVSDLCGEKLDETFVGSCFDHAAPEQASFSMLLAGQRPRRYELILDKMQWSHQAAEVYTRKVEQQLQKNPQYLYAVSIGQLAPLQPLRVASPWLRYRNFMLDKGARLGEIKPPVLATHVGLREYFLQSNSVSNRLELDRV